MRAVELAFNARCDAHVLNPDAIPAAYSFLGPTRASQVRRFHASFPEYVPTPLYSLDGLAARLGLGRIFVKDESRRFGLKAFKALARPGPWPAFFPGVWSCRRTASVLRSGRRRRGKEWGR